MPAYPHPPRKSFIFPNINSFTMRKNGRHDQNCPAHWTGAAPSLLATALASKRIRNASSRDRVNKTAWMITCDRR